MIDRENKQRGCVYRLYLDWDGTITGMPGGALVNTPFFQGSVIQNEAYQAKRNKANYRQDYWNAKINDSLDQNLVEHFENNKKRDSNLRAPERMTKDAVEFLKEASSLASKGESIDIVIITKNIEDYIKALLKYEKFSEQQRIRFTIYDVTNGGGVKNQAVALHEQKRGPAENYLVLDDKEEELNAMKSSLPAGVKVNAVCCESGQFKWDEYAKEINKSKSIPLIKNSLFHSNENESKTEVKSAPPSPRKT